ncbi:PREDICTED: RING-H2 [Prunus dulcis]|uniref:RING-type E3 ubiquitin transferase n=1 Tax=Prunus dulcis TaxID=3755 RepID=A0A5E4G1Z6_PRUDU|nr:RING-H2 finger protein ATL52-like [Prunus dulcis]KAI5327557.1 hypothetical protein L3X38_026953 [Prunus dulcis]VVA33767.1 PREDICTED: RING-H2 [Prunus dulcis]
MGSLGGSPKTWIPYMNTKDCSQGFCSLYCPQWCYRIIPPPPVLEFPEDNSSSPSFSPLVIAIIGILVSAFLLVSYYTIISKYCGNSDRRRARREDQEQNEEMEDPHNPSIHEPWHVVTAGLDEALIKSLTVCKYKKGDGFVEGTDCSVCLSEFEEDERLRLLPKCNHAFHLPCIDTWLKCHSNCPLCRANIVPHQLPHPAVIETPSSTNHDASSMAESQPAHDQNVVMAQTSERGPSQNEESMQGDHEGYHQAIRRSVSMDDWRQNNQVLVADILSRNDEEDEEDDMNSESDDIAEGVGKSSNRKRVLLHCVMSPVAMKRSFSSGRFFPTRPSRARNTVLPV